MKKISPKEMVDINELCKDDSIEDKLVLIASSNSYHSLKLNIETDIELKDISFVYEDLYNEKNIVKSSRWTCYNLQGVDCNGDEFTKKMNVTNKTVMWFGIDLSELENGLYTGLIHLKSEEILIKTYTVELEIVDNHYEELPRLSWLNSTLGQDEVLIKDFSPIKTADKVIEVNEKSIVLADHGLIESICYNQEDFLKRPLSFKVLSHSLELAYKESPWTQILSSETKCMYQKLFTYSSFSILVDMLVSFEGYIKVDFTFSGDEEIDISFELACFLNEKYVRYMMGLDFDGGLYKPYDFTFNKQHQDSIWLGSPMLGLALKFKDDTYRMPFSNVYYNNRPLNKSLWNKISLTSDYELKAKTETFHIHPDEKKTLSVEMNVTPFKKLDMKKHFNNRYYQPKENSDIMSCIDDITDKRCQILNIHHGQEIYPYINYPFNNKEALSKVIQACHHKDIRVKLYYTMRELSHHIDELQAFLSLDYEIFPKNTYKGDAFWDVRNKRMKESDGLDIGYHEGYVRKNLDKDLIPAWEHHFDNGQVCAAILTETHSRLINYYMVGLKWMMDELDIDGIYIDDTYLDRSSMIRLRRISQSKDDFNIDLHSWNHRHEFAGQVSSIMLYMQHLPFVDRLWLGESYDYNKGPDYWLTEISGIPFGLTGDMLEGDGHVYRGMVYGMTNRTKWGRKDPLPIYELWDDFGIQDSKMIGYWEEEGFELEDNDIKLTCYYKKDCVLLVFASWSDEDTLVDLRDLKINYQGVYCPQITGLQDYKKVKDKKIKIVSNQGRILICEY